MLSGKRCRAGLSAMARAAAARGTGGPLSSPQGPQGLARTLDFQAAAPTGRKWSVVESAGGLGRCRVGKGPLESPFEFRDSPFFSQNLGLSQGAQPPGPGQWGSVIPMGVLG